MNDLESRLADLSATEMVNALGLRSAPASFRDALARTLKFASTPTARIVARLDHEIANVGLQYAAMGALQRFGAVLETYGQSEMPKNGSILILSNHPGAYDVLAVVSAISRPDLAVIAAERSFLRALPNWSSRLLFVPDLHGGNDVPARTKGLRQALRHLSHGGALLHFAAGQIEPDPAFLTRGESPLKTWHRSTAALVRAVDKGGGSVILAMVSGVHSKRAKDFWLTRWAERKGISTLAPLLQASVPGFRHVHARVRFDGPYKLSELVSNGQSDEEITASLHACALGLASIR